MLVFEFPVHLLCVGLLYLFLFFVLFAHTHRREIRNNASKEPILHGIDPPHGFIVPYPKHFLEVRIFVVFVLFPSFSTAVSAVAVAAAAAAVAASVRCVVAVT